MKPKITFITTAVLTLVCLTGCSAGRRAATQTAPSQTETQQASDDNPADGDQLLAACTLTGTVIEFSDDGCQISPSFAEDELMYEAAQGYETESDLVRVIYQEGCTFEIAAIDLISGSADYTSAGTDAVKKQTRVVIYGEYDSEIICSRTRSIFTAPMAFNRRKELCYELQAKGISLSMA